MTAWCVHHFMIGLNHRCKLGMVIDQRYRKGLRFRMPCCTDVSDEFQKSPCVSCSLPPGEEIEPAVTKDLLTNLADMPTLMRVLKWFSGEMTCPRCSCVLTFTTVLAERGFYTKLRCSTEGCIRSG